MFSFMARFLAASFGLLNLSPPNFCSSFSRTRRCGRKKLITLGKHCAHSQSSCPSSEEAHCSLRQHGPALALANTADRLDLWSTTADHFDLESTGADRLDHGSTPVVETAGAVG